MPIIPATQEAEISCRFKASYLSIHKLGVVAHTWDPSYEGGHR
jgi:hypothetical protein